MTLKALSIYLSSEMHWQFSWKYSSNTAHFWRSEDWDVPRFIGQWIWPPSLGVSQTILTNSCISLLCFKGLMKKSPGVGKMETYNKMKATWSTCYSSQSRNRGMHLNHTATNNTFAMCFTERLANSAKRFTRKNHGCRHAKSQQIRSMANSGQETMQTESR